MIAAKKNRVRLRLPGSIYRKESIAAGACVLGEKAKVFFGKKGTDWEIELHFTKLTCPSDRTRLVGEFLNEALGRNFRQQVIRFNRPISKIILSRLWRAFETMPPDPLEQMEPQIQIDRQEETSKLMEAARQMKRT